MYEESSSSSRVVRPAQIIRQELLHFENEGHIC